MTDVPNSSSKPENKSIGQDDGNSSRLPLLPTVLINQSTQPFQEVAPFQEATENVTGSYQLGCEKQNTTLGNMPNISSQSDKVSNKDFKENETEAKTVEEMFAFINEGFHSEAPSHRKSTSSPETALSSVTSPGLKTGNIVNFNRTASLKESNPIKEIDEFLPEEKTLDLSLTTTTWKGRTPPASLGKFDFDKNELMTHAQNQSRFSDSIKGLARRPRSKSISDSTENSISEILVSSKEKLTKDRKKRASFADVPTKMSKLKSKVQIKQGKGSPLKLQIPINEQFNQKQRKIKQENQRYEGTVKEKNNTPTSPDKKSRQEFRDTINAKEEFSIHGLVTQANASYISAPSNSLPPSNFHVSVGSQEPRLALIPSASLEATQTFPEQQVHSQTHQKELDENVRVYVNVNVNMNKECGSQQSNGFRTAQQPESIDGTRPKHPLGGNHYLKVKETHLSDKTFSAVSDDEFSSSDGGISPMSDTDLNKQTNFKGDSQIRSMPNNLSSPSLDRFRLVQNLGPSGLSPIPSESYESDSTNFHTDSSIFNDENRTPVASDHLSTSSDSTIKAVDSDSDSSKGKDPHQRWQRSFKAELGKGKARKISFEHKEWQDIDSADEGRHYGMHQHVRKARSYSHPEQYLLAKRKAAMERMNMGGHLNVEKTFSDPVSNEQLEDNNESRFPLRSDIMAFDSFKTRLGSNSTGTGYFSSSNVTRQEMAQHWYPRSPYSERVSRSSSFLSEGSRSVRRIRQLSVDIGEEWENIHPPPRDRTTSFGSEASGFSYRSLRKKRVTTDKLAGMHSLSFKSPPFRGKLDDMHNPEKPCEYLPDNVRVAEEIDSPLAEILEAESRASPSVKTDSPVIVEVTSTEDHFEDVPGKLRINLDNPYNSINQRFHATLHCPCFLFFCFLCCAPAVYWMQRSDYEFDHGSEKLAKKYGRRSTALYISGIAVSLIIFISAAITAYFYLGHQLTQRGHFE